MNTGVIVGLLLLFLIVYLAATGRLTSVWSSITGATTKKG